MSSSEECQISEEVDYFHQQIFDPESESDYSLQLSVNMSGIFFFDFLEGKKNSKIFQIVDSNTEETLTSITVLKNSNGLVTYFNKSTGKKIEKIRISTKKTTQISKKKSLKIKLQQLKIKNYQKIPKEEIETSKKQAKVISTTGDYAGPAALFSSALLIIESGDPTESILKFTQFISIVKKLKFINLKFGQKFESALNNLGGWTDEKENIYQMKALGVEERILAFTENYEEEIVKKEKGYKGKFNRFLEGFDFTLMIKIKESFYLIFWILNIYSMEILKNVENSGVMCSESKLKFIKIVRKIRLVLINSSILDFLFFGTRFLLHQKTLSFKDAFWKSLVLVIINLKIYDLMEIFSATQKLQFFFEKNEKKLKLNKIIPKEDSHNESTIAKLTEKISSKKVIDFEKTFRYHQRNKAIENFSKEYIQASKEAYNSIFILHSNGLSLLRLCVSQILIVSLINLPLLLVALLLINEIFFSLVPILISLFTKAKIKILPLISKIIQFVCLGGLFIVFFIIGVRQRKMDDDEPVSASLQSIGLNVIFSGYFLEILLLIISLILTFWKTVKEKKMKKKNVVQDIPKIGELEGEYFYKFEVEKLENGRNVIMSGMEMLNESFKDEMKGKKNDDATLKKKKGNRKYDGKRNLFWRDYHGNQKGEKPVNGEKDNQEGEFGEGISKNRIKDSLESRKKLKVYLD